MIVRRSFDGAASRRDEILITFDVSCVKVALCKLSMGGSLSITWSLDGVPDKWNNHRKIERYVSPIDSPAVSPAVSNRTR